MNLLLRVSNYITRYAPSEKKLREYIGKKNYTFHTNDFLREIGYSESMMCDMWIRTFLSGSKGEHDMREKLRKKGFPVELIESRISVHLSDIQSWDSHRGHIESSIDGLIRKGKSKQIITMTLTQKYPYFRDEIATLIEGKSHNSGLEKEIEKYLSKYDISDFNGKSKFFAALQRKGFGYREIQNFLKQRGDRDV